MGSIIIGVIIVVLFIVVAVWTFTRPSGWAEIGNSVHEAERCEKCGLLVWQADKDSECAYCKSEREGYNNR